MGLGIPWHGAEAGVVVGSSFNAGGMLCAGSGRMGSVCSLVKGMGSGFWGEFWLPHLLNMQFCFKQVPFQGLDFFLCEMGRKSISPIR